MTDLVILDIDGTLVDSNYQHTLAWAQAFASVELVIPLWRIHRSIGMGGDQIVASLAGDEAEARSGDRIRTAEQKSFGELISGVAAFEGAAAAVRSLKERGFAVVLSSSAKDEEVEHYIGLLGIEGVADAATSSGDVKATKPEPDLIQAAMERVGATEALMIGDSIWDVKAALRAQNVAVIAVLTGGFGAAELYDAGAETVVETVSDAVGSLKPR